jgi:hypothetical protein
MGLIGVDRQVLLVYKSHRSHPLPEPERILPTRDANALRRSDRQRISVEFLLVPVRVNQRYGTGSVEFPNLISRQVPADGS